MDKERLKKLVGSANFILGIHNYCDRWCDRCPKTAHCSVFALTTESGVGPDTHDPRNQIFWRQLDETLTVAMDLLKESADRAGIGLDSLRKESVAALREVPEEPACPQEICLVSKAYAQRVGDLLDAWRDVFEEGDGLGTSLGGKQRNPRESWGEAQEVIGWYQHLIYVKIRRALQSRSQEALEALVDVPEDSQLSAKVALIAIDRSIAAWTLLRKQFRSHEDEIFDILVLLDRLRRSVETVFPSARGCLRPGFEDLDRNSSQ